MSFFSPCGLSTLGTPYVVVAIISATALGAVVVTLGLSLVHFCLWFFHRHTDRATSDRHNAIWYIRLTVWLIVSFIALTAIVNVDIQNCYARLPEGVNY